MCKREYNYVCPIYSIQNDFTNNNAKQSKHKKQNNYCSVKCLQEYISNLTIHFHEDSVYMAYIPIMHLEMCQFCGDYTHPMEFCTTHFSEQEQLEKVTTVGNKVGEWAICTGDVVYSIIGKNCNLEITKTKFGATMQKLHPEKIEERNPLVYFWWSEDSCHEIVSELKTDETIEFEKQVITEVKPILAQQPHDETSLIMLYKTKKIINPNKMFFPYNIQDENCWWPIDHYQTTEKIQTYDMMEKPVETITIDYDIENIFKYDDEEFDPKNIVAPDIDKGMGVDIEEKSAPIQEEEEQKN